MKIPAMIAFALISAACARDALSPPAPGWNTLSGAAPMIIAHRGASGYRPEHTLEAYALAIEQGADVIEPDLVVTKDGVLIARHDRYLSTTTNVADRPEFASRKRIDPDPNGQGREDWWAEDFTLAELKTLRARQSVPGRSQAYDDLYEIPTLEDILALIEIKAAETGRRIGVYPETKSPGYFERIGLSFDAPLLAALDGFGAGPVFIQSFEPRILKRLHGRTPHKLVQLVYEENPGAGSNIPLANIATYADGVGPNKDMLIDIGLKDTGFLRQAHSLGLFVHSWTFRNDVDNSIVQYFRDTYDIVGDEDLQFDDPTKPEAEYQLFYLLGVDGVFTDFPDTAVKVRDAMDR
ncbi:MAG: glycerophosphodiester phosphodiesterase family protein [Pseudomonadota bacterium]